MTAVYSAGRWSVYPISLRAISKMKAPAEILSGGSKDGARAVVSESPEVERRNGEPADLAPAAGLVEGQDRRRKDAAIGRETADAGARGPLFRFPFEDGAPDQVVDLAGAIAELADGKRFLRRLDRAHRAPPIPDSIRPGKRALAGGRIQGLRKFSSLHGIETLIVYSPRRFPERRREIAKVPAGVISAGVIVTLCSSPLSIEMISVDRFFRFRRRGCSSPANPMTSAANEVESPVWMIGRGGVSRRPTVRKSPETLSVPFWNSMRVLPIGSFGTSKMHARGDSATI